MLASQELRLLQINLHKHKERTHAILNDPDVKDYTLLLLQEQYWSSFMTSSPMHQSWTLHEPTLKAQGKQPRAVIYTNNAQLTPAQISQIDLPFTDALAISIQMNCEGTKKNILVANIYNPCGASIIQGIHNTLVTHLRQKEYDIILLTGDFNCHHPLWNPRHHSAHDATGDELVEAISDLKLELLLPPGTVTYPQAKTAIDLVWGNANAARGLLKCRTAPNKDFGSDHLPIETFIAVARDEKKKMTPSYNYLKTNWEEFTYKLNRGLPSLADRQNIRTKTEVETLTQELITSITKAVQESTPRRKPSPHSKRWWTYELTKIRREANRLRNIFHLTGREIDRQAWKQKDNIYVKEIEKAKKTKWQEFVKDADEKSIWQIKKYIDSKTSQTVIPTLDDKAITQAEKVDLLKQAFFPAPPRADLTDTQDAQYPQEIPFEPTITIQQIRNAVNRVLPNKAPGPDGITNQVLKKALPVIEKHLQAILQASLNPGYFPKIFRTSTTVVMRKPGKPDYTRSKAYRPIALENTMGKIFESVMAETFSYLTETHRLLPNHHYGGRPGRSTEDALMALSESIHQAWKQKKVFSAVFLDVAGAFNNVHHKRLMHNLRMRRIPAMIVNWLQSFLQNRSTKLLFNGEKSDDVAIPAGIPQGSPLSPLLYMYYNAELLEVLSECNHDVSLALALGFIDDVVYGVRGISARSNVRTLQHMLQQAEVWRKKHGSQFERSKYILIHFTRNRREPTDASITIGNTVIQPSTEARYLGVIFDQQLRFKSHTQQAVKKGTSAALALNRIANCNWGAPHKHIRQLFQAVVAPRLDYAAVIWNRPKADRSALATACNRTFTTVQRIAMKAILGCFRTTPTAAMEMESGLQPAWIRLQTKVLISVTRMQSLSIHHPIHTYISDALRTRTACCTHTSVLENVFKQFPIATQQLEPIEPFIRPPWYTPRLHFQAEESKDAAKQRHDESLNNTAQCMVFYTDGSGITNKIGAASYCVTTGETQHQYLGSDSQFNVHAAELVGIHLAIKHWLRQPTPPKICQIYTDSKAAGASLSQLKRPPAQSLTKSILDTLDSAPQSHHVKLTWIPGHVDIDGNEQADKEAKRAATDPTLSQPFNRGTLKSARTQQIKQMAQQQWDKEWTNHTKTASLLHHIMKARTSKVGPKYYNNINSRKASTTLAQLRTSHCALNGYLNRFGKVTSPYCECGYGKETVQHFLLECRRFKNERTKLRTEVGTGRMKIAWLLGNKGMASHTMEYIGSTGRLQSR